MGAFRPKAADSTCGDDTVKCSADLFPPNIHPMQFWPGWFLSHMCYAAVQGLQLVVDADTCDKSFD